MQLKNKFNHSILLSRKKYRYPLLRNGLDKSDLEKGIQVIQSGHITMNKHTEIFEKKFAKKLKTKYAVMVNSGSSANLLATFASCNPLRKNRFKKGDNAIIQSLCWSTSLWPLVQAGLKVKFVDVNPLSLNVNVEDIISKVNLKTKVIMIINVLGLSCDILRLKNFCRKKKIILIEDAAPALGSYVKNKPVGRFGDFACFSFHETKNYQSGMGGLLVVNNNKFKKKSDLVFDKGTDRTLVVSDPNYHKKYYTWVEMGSCFRLPELNASYLQPQIGDIKKIIKYRSLLYKRYVKNFKGWLKDEFLICNKLKHKYKYNYHAFTIILKKNERERFLKYLKKNKIIAFIGFMPLHMSKVGKKFVNNKNKLNCTEETVKKIVRLPMHNRLTIKDIDIVSKNIKNYFNKKN